MDSECWEPGRLSRSRGRAARRTLDFDDTKYAIGGNKYTSDETETNLYISRGIRAMNNMKFPTTNAIDIAIMKIKMMMMNV